MKKPSGEWTCREVGTYTDGSDAYALIDPEGRERMVGERDEIEFIVEAIRIAIDIATSPPAGA